MSQQLQTSSDTHFFHIYTTVVNINTNTKAISKYDIVWYGMIWWALMSHLT